RENNTNTKILTLATYSDSITNLPAITAKDCITSYCNTTGNFPHPILAISFYYIHNSKGFSNPD
ncbi:hypothetical protein P7M08_24955, partial [Vibrio parahaemolyticus]|nr:hypothetical protein [Vibrio parahaemolyticus]